MTTPTALAAGPILQPPTYRDPNCEIIAVDPDSGIRRVIALVLEELGCTTHTVADGEAALALLDEINPALVVSEVRLPGMDGVQLAERIRDRGGRQPAIYLMSAYPRPAPGRTDGFLVKPLRFDLLLEVVREAMTSDS